MEHSASPSSLPIDSGDGNDPLARNHFPGPESFPGPGIISRVRNHRVIQIDA